MYEANKIQILFHSNENYFSGLNYSKDMKLKNIENFCKILLEFIEFKFFAVFVVGLHTRTILFWFPYDKF